MINNLELTNFGPFFGKHQLDLKPGVNIISGRNGSGKTCIFRAIRFGLFGNLISEHNQIDKKLINRQYLRSGGQSAVVKITFTLLGKKYYIERSITADGEIEIVVNGQAGLFLDQIYDKIPPYTSQFFLFDGEEIRQLVMSLSNDIWDTAAVLGFNIFHGVATDIETVKKSINRSITEIEKHAGITQLQNECEALTTEIDKNKESVQLISRKIEGIELESKLCKQLLKSAEKYEISETELKEMDNEVKKIEHELRLTWKTAKKNAQHASYSILKTHFMEALKLVEHMKELTFNARLDQGRLDAQVEILQEIDQNERCICGNELGASKFGKRAIADLVGDIEVDMKKFDKAASAEFWPAITLMDMLSKLELSDRKAAELKRNLESIDQLEEQLDKIARDQLKIKTEMQDIRKNALPLMSKIDGSRKTWRSSSNLNKRLTKLEREKNVLSGRLDIFKDLIKLKQEDLKGNKNKMERLVSQKREQLDKLRTAYQRVEHTSEIINDSVDNAVMHVIKDLKKRFNEIFKKITNKPTEYIDVAFSSSEGNPLIITRDGTSLSMTDISDGEKQILMFALMSALKDLSTTDTLVIDAPFGRLDAVHSDSITTFLPDMAKQIILMITDREFSEINKHDLDSINWRIENNENTSKLELLK